MNVQVPLRSLETLKEKALNVPVSDAREVDKFLNYVRDFVNDIVSGADEIIVVNAWKAKHPKKDYRMCDSCSVGFDLWKYGDLKSTGHGRHILRDLTDEEYEEAVKQCLEDGCDKEQ